MDDLEEYERLLLAKLAELERDYRKAAEPILRDLAEIERRKPPKPIVITRLLDGTCVPIEADRK